MRSVPYAWGLLVVLMLVLPTGCARRKHQQTSPVQVSRTALVTGYDPAWSPDGSRIAYVEAAYQSHGMNGIFFDSRKDEPAPRNSICVWDVKSGHRRVIQLTQSSNDFVSSLVWRNNNEVMFLVTDLRRVDRLRFEGRWHWLAIYRHSEVPKKVAVYNLPMNELTVLSPHLAAVPIELEPLEEGSGRTAVWEYQKSEGDDTTGTRVSEVIGSSGQLGDRLSLPPARWSGVAAATRRTQVPVAVRASAKWKRCLSRVDRGSYADFYCPGKMIEGVYGSPDGKRVAFLEQIPSQLPGPRMDLKAIRVSGGDPVLVTNNAWPWSHVAWSPDGRRIAYVKAENGEIAIETVPRDTK